MKEDQWVQGTYLMGMSNPKYCILGFMAKNIRPDNMDLGIYQIRDYLSNIGLANPTGQITTLNDDSPTFQQAQTSIIKRLKSLQKVEKYLNKNS